MGVLKVWNILPEGLFVDDVIAVARRELAWEVDYEREAECGERFRYTVCVGRVWGKVQVHCVCGQSVGKGSGTLCVWAECGERFRYTACVGRVWGKVQVHCVCGQSVGKGSGTLCVWAECQVHCVCVVQ